MPKNTQHDRAMSLKLKYGPSQSREKFEKSDAQKAQEAAMWKMRVENGMAGLPGSQYGSGAHKDMGGYDRKRDKYNPKRDSREADSDMVARVASRYLKDTEKSR